jgi:hypothetical protein
MIHRLISEPRPSLWFPDVSVRARPLLTYATTNRELQCISVTVHTILIITTYILTK